MRLKSMIIRLLKRLDRVIQEGFFPDIDDDGR